MQSIAVNIAHSPAQNTSEINAFFFCRSELRAIQEAETEEIEQRDQIARELEDEIRLTTCFVEFLNGFQLIDSLFAGDENARVLLSVVGAEALFKE